MSLPNDPTNPGGGGSGGGGAPASYGTPVWDINFQKLDAGSGVELLAYLNCYNQDDLRFSAYMFVDDTLVQVGTVNALFDQSNSQAQMTMTVVQIVDGLSTGQHNFKLRVKNRETEGPLVVQAGSLVKITEVRQGGR